MAVDIELATNLIQQANRQIGLVKKAPNLDKYPTKIEASDLPYLLTWPGPGRTYVKGGGWKVDIRTFMVIGYVQPFGLNDIPSRAVQAVRCFQAVEANFITAATIPLADPDTNNGYQITVTSGPDNPHTDDGLVSNLVFGGTTYHGFILNLNVHIMWL